MACCLLLLVGLLVAYLVSCCLLLFLLIQQCFSCCNSCCCSVGVLLLLLLLLMLQFKQILNVLSFLFALFVNSSTVNLKFSLLLLCSCLIKHVCLVLGNDVVIAAVVAVLVLIFSLLAMTSPDSRFTTCCRVVVVDYDDSLLLPF